MPDTTGESVKNPENEAENPAPMPKATIRTDKPATRGPQKPTDPAGQQGGTHGGGRG